MYFGQVYPKISKSKIYLIYKLQMQLRQVQSKQVKLKYKAETIDLILIRVVDPYIIIESNRKSQMSC